MYGRNVTTESACGLSCHSGELTYNVLATPPAKTPIELDQLRLNRRLGCKSKLVPGLLLTWNTLDEPAE